MFEIGEEDQWAIRQIVEVMKTLADQHVNLPGHPNTLNTMALCKIHEILAEAGHLPAPESAENVE